METAATANHHGFHGFGIVQRTPQNGNAMTARPLVTIIVSVYNVASYLDTCLTSLVGQTYTNLEIILIDDGSSDTSPKICDAWANTDKRITSLHQQNQGVSAARNTGLDHAHGTYYAFVDGDDYVELNYIESMVARITADGTDMVICSFVRENHDNRPLEMQDKTSVDRPTILSQQECLNRFRIGYEYILAWNKLYCSTLWDTYRYPSGKIHEDEFAFHHIIARCKTISVIPDRLYHYVSHNGSITHSEYSARNLDIVEALTQRLRFFVDRGYKHAARTTFDALITYIVRATRLDRSQDTRNRLKELYRDLHALPFRKTLHILSPKQRIKYCLALAYPQLLHRIVATGSSDR